MNAVLCLVLLLMTACSHQPAKPTAGAELKGVIDRYTEATKRLDPFFAPYFSLEEDLPKFGDYPSPEYFTRSRQLLERTMAELKQVNRAGLNPDEERTYKLFEGDLSSSIALDKLPNRYLAFHQMDNRLTGLQNSANPAYGNFPFDSVKHYRDYLSRLLGLPAYVDRQIALLREGVEKKIVLGCIVAGRIPLSYRDSLEPDPVKSPFYLPIKQMPASFSEAERKELSEAYAKIVRETVQPSYARFDKFFREEYTPHCRQGFGLNSLPGGDAWYRTHIRALTDLELDPREVHETGLREVERIAKEMSAIQKQAGFRGTLRQYLKKRVGDPASYFSSAEAMFAAFAEAKKATAAQIPNYFALTPKADYRLVEASNPEEAAGSYMQPTDSTPEGRFVVNTKNLKSVPKYGVNTLLLHEAVPGHHFQLALVYEMKDRLSDYQRLLFFSNSFVEGWALYAEYLGNEMGLLKDPDQRYGHLDAEMLRAVRLVVDTGIHAYGWSQKKALDFARRYLAMDNRSLETEINRYSVMPGQALGYKIGQLKILSLRKEAEAALGDRFDIKGFHRAVIGNGTVSLPVLEEQVHEWMSSVAGGKK